MKSGSSRKLEERWLFLDDAHFVVFCKEGAEGFVTVELLDIVRQFVDGGVDVLVYPVEWPALLTFCHDAIACVFGTVDLCGGVASLGELTGVFVPCAVSDFPLTAGTEAFGEGAVDDYPSPTRSVGTESSVTGKAELDLVGRIIDRLLVNELREGGGELSCGMGARGEGGTGTGSDTHCPFGYEIVEFLHCK